MKNITRRQPQKRSLQANLLALMPPRPQALSRPITTDPDMSPSGGAGGWPYPDMAAMAAAEAQEVDESGAKFLLKSEFTDPTALKNTLAEMGPEELHMFRIGMVQALKTKIGDTVVRADVTKKLMDVPALEQKIRAAFGDDDLFQQYAEEYASREA